MGLPYTGAWRRASVPYVGAGVWGTGINPVHSFYGSDNLRVEGRSDADPSRTPPSEAMPHGFYNLTAWGYTPEDHTYTNVEMDGRPTLGSESPQWRGRGVQQPPVDADGQWKTVFRSMIAGARRGNYKQVDSLPSETVTEGWRNKPKGSPANSVPSDPSQYEIQTSMVQRYQVRNNTAAVSRGTDGERSRIASRVTGQKLKLYSGEERHYDMFPFQQDIIYRPFWYRTAGTGDPAEMQANYGYEIDPIQRVPPPDPDLGPEETSSQFDYGYTSEDSQYGY
jgi:hypothetical protein